MHGAEEVKIEVDMLAPGAERLFPKKNIEVEVIAPDVTFGEGPIWDKRTKQLFYVDICGDSIWKWKQGGKPECIMNPSDHADGMVLDAQGRLVIAGWGGRTVFRMDIDGGNKTTLASHWQGKKLNSPNDIVVHSDGSIYFTDPNGGLLNVGMVGDDIQKYLDMNPVFRIAPDGTLSIANDDAVYPNGLCFSPDEKLLYINCSRERVVRVYDMRPDGGLGEGRMFYRYTDPERGVPDGMKCDVEGNVYDTGPGGIWMHDPQGNVLARLKTPGWHPINFAFGDDDWRTLYITFIGCVTRSRMPIAGVPAL